MTTREVIFDKIAGTTRKRIHLSELINGKNEEEIDHLIAEVFGEHPELGTFDRSNGWIEVAEEVYQGNRLRKNKSNFFRFGLLSLFLMVFGAVLITPLNLIAWGIFVATVGFTMMLYRIYMLIGGKGDKMHAAATILATLSWP